MKRHMGKLILIAVLISAVLLVFGQDENPAATKTTSTLPRLGYASADSAIDFRNFNAKAGLDIEKNRKTIAALKTEPAATTQVAQTDAQENVLKLEALNDHLASRINSSDMIQTKNWTGFKNDFSREMAELKTAIQQLTEGTDKP